MLARLREQFPRLGHVVETEPIARRLRRVRIAGDALRDLPYLPGQQLRIRLTPTIFMRDSLRTYSVWRYDPAQGVFDLCILPARRRTAHALGRGGPGRGSRHLLGAPRSLRARARRPLPCVRRRGDRGRRHPGDDPRPSAFGQNLLPTRGRHPRGRAPRARPQRHRPALGSSRGPACRAGERAGGAVTRLELPGVPGAAYFAGEAADLRRPPTPLHRRARLAAARGPRQAVLGSEAEGTRASAVRERAAPTRRSRPRSRARRGSAPSPCPA